MDTTVVRDLMSPIPTTLSEDEAFTSANEIMKLERIRNRPLLKGRRLVGPVRGAEDMSEARLTCAPTTPMEDARRVMFDAEAKCMLVVEDGQLVGVLTENAVLGWVVDMLARLRFEWEPPGSGSGG